jgi:hypothetical protein
MAAERRRNVEVIASHDVVDTHSRTGNDVPNDLIDAGEMEM